jgi:SulP family sulfate permease
MASAVDVHHHDEARLNQELIGGRAVELPTGVLVYAIDGPVFFAAVESFERALAHTHTDPQVLIMRLGRVPFIDITGLQALEEVIENVGHRHVEVILCEANPRVKAEMVRAGVLAMVGEQHYVEHIGDALALASRLTGHDTGDHSHHDHDRDHAHHAGHAHDHAEHRGLPLPLPANPSPTG